MNNNRKMFVAYMLISVLILTACGASNEITTEEQAVEITTEAITEELDTTSPVIELATNGVAYYIGDKYDPMSYILSVTDDSGETIKVDYNDDNVNIATPGDYVITYSAKDSAGNRTEEIMDFRVKKEYSREEIKDIIQRLIDDKYYIFELEDELEVNPDDYAEGTICGALGIYGKYENDVSNRPITGIWGSDTNIYVTVDTIIHVNTNNLGVKNHNTDTLNSELILLAFFQSGETKVGKAEYIEIASDGGKMKIDNIYGGGSFIIDKEGYFKHARTDFCFESEEQINRFKNIIQSSNVSIMVHDEAGNDTSFILQRDQCENWLKVIRFYEDINEYVNNKTQ